MANTPRSEYEGGGVMPNSVFPKGVEALTASDKLRLGYITGQETDSRATPDPGAFYGNSYFDVNEVPKPAPEQKARQAENLRIERLRYRESPR